VPVTDAAVRRDAPFAHRYIEDFIVGEVFEYGGYEVTEAHIIEFAKRYDPQDFHTDPEAAKSSVFGGLISSGLQTSSVFMAQMVEAFPNVASLGSPGWDDLRWPNPVRPGDVLSVRSETVEARLSKSRPEMGILSGRHVMSKQDGSPVFTLKNYWFVGRREPGT